MADRIEQFVRAWISENVYPIPGLEDLPREISRLATKMTADAGICGIGEDELMKSLGDINDSLTHEYEKVHDPELGFRGA